MNPEPTKLKPGRGVSASAAEAARTVAAAGGSPRAQIDAARAVAPDKRLGYLPHCGAKERAKNLRRLAAVHQETTNG